MQSISASTERRYAAKTKLTTLLQSRTETLALFNQVQPVGWIASL